MEKHFSSASAGRIAYYEFGPQQAEETLIFIHGLAGNSSIWFESIALLSKSIKCYTIDLPGNGESEYKAELNYNLELYVFVLKEFIQKNNITNFSLVGHSMGAQIALKYTYENIIIPRQLILTSPSGFEEFSGIEKVMLKSGMDFFPNNFIIEPIRIHLISKLLPEQKAKFNHINIRKVCVDNIISMLDENVIDKLPLLNLPVHIIYGNADELIPNKFIHPYKTIEQIMQRAALKLKLCEIISFENGGHFIPIQFPNQFAEILLNTLVLEKAK